MADDVVMWRGKPLDQMDKPELIAALQHMARLQSRAQDDREKEREVFRAVLAGRGQ